MSELKKQTITVTNEEGDELKLTLASDCNANEWLSSFRTIMFWLTFIPETIDQYLPENESYDVEKNYN